MVIFQVVSKKGETIIEVMVAMSILALVLVGVYTVVVRITGIEAASRDRTISTNQAQKTLNEYMRAVTDSCSVSLAGSGVDTTTANPTGCYHSPEYVPGDANFRNPCSYIEVVNPIPTGSNEANDLGTDASSFVKVISHVIWYDTKTNTRNEIQLSEITRKAR